MLLLYKSIFVVSKHFLKMNYNRKYLIQNFESLQLLDNNRKNIFNLKEIIDYELVVVVELVLVDSEA